MSSTRIPAKGKVGELTGSVARPRYLMLCEPLRSMWGLTCLVRVRENFVQYIVIGAASEDVRAGDATKVLEYSVLGEIIV